MKIQINISNKTAYVLMGILGLMIISSFVYAYNPSGTGGNPAVMGHSLDELSIPNCVEGQILKKVSGAWTCASDNSGTGGTTLPTCTNGQILKYSSGTWTCSSDTDTKCSTSGTCSQICIGTNCRTSWPNATLYRAYISCAEGKDYTGCMAYCPNGYGLANPIDWKCNNDCAEDVTYSGSTAILRCLNCQYGYASGSGYCTKMD